MQAETGSGVVLMKYPRILWLSGILSWHRTNKTAALLYKRINLFIFSNATVVTQNKTEVVLRKVSHPFYGYIKKVTITNIEIII